MTPMVRQYYAIKASYQDSLLFYRVGDFYELFFDDARKAANILDITLTKKNKCNGEEIPMCGVPHHSAYSYIKKLMRRGYNVAICDQIETVEQAKKRGYKAIIKREVVRIITPGTLIEDNWLESKHANFLLTITEFKGSFAVSWADVSTGDFFSMNCDLLDVINQINKLEPKEILLTNKTFEKINLCRFLKKKNIFITKKTDTSFNYKKCEQIMKYYYGVNSIKGLGYFTIEQIIGAGVILEYLCYTHKSHIPKLKNLYNVDLSGYMKIDMGSMCNLELEKSNSGNKALSLINIIDKTITAPAGRLLRERLKSPSCDINLINIRLDCVDYFYQNDYVRIKLRDMLLHFPDLPRSLAKIYSHKSAISDLNKISRGLKIARIIFHYLIEVKHLTTELKSLMIRMPNTCQLQDELNSALVQTVISNNGSFIKMNYNLKLDELYKEKTLIQKQLKNLKDKYLLLTGIKNLKILHNNIIGFFIEINNKSINNIATKIFRHKQSLGSVSRFYTSELKVIETHFSCINYRIKILEDAMLSQLCDKVKLRFHEINVTVSIVANIDFFSALATLAHDNGYVKPIIDQSDNFQITEGRHPVLVHLIKDKFVTNSCYFNSKEKTWLLTGPNMAGKNTFLRQKALIIIMGQIGSYVPATKAYFGIVDKVFLRIGANDNIAQGESTFMVEMMETACILNNATIQSFVVFDEVGRGTSTCDGLAIAWSVLYYLHCNIKCRTLFATHYHELTDMVAAGLSNIINKTVALEKYGEDIVFLYKVISGASKNSYGVHIAKLAGLPRQVISHANIMLAKLKRDQRRTAFLSKKVKLCHILMSVVKNININNTTPIEALTLLYKIIDILRS